MKKTICAAALFLVSLTCLSFPSLASGWTVEDGGTRWYNKDGNYSCNMWKNGEDGAPRWLGSDGYEAVSTWVKDGDKYYYVGEDGRKLVNTWAELAPPAEEKSSGSGPFWYLFGPTGKRLESRWEERGGKRYYLGENGAMETGWILDNLYYTGEDGSAVTGWQHLESPEGGEKDYWFNPKGKKYVPEDGEAFALKRIDGSRYCFDADGALASGLCRVRKKDGSYVVYYFGEPGEEELHTGLQRITLEDGTEEEYRFDKNGEGLTEVLNGKLYYNGKLQTAERAERYRAVTVPSDEGARNYLVDAAGHIRKGRTVLSRSGVRYETDADGILLTVDGRSAAGMSFDSPDEPDVRT